MPKKTLSKSPKKNSRKKSQKITGTSIEKQIEEFGEDIAREADDVERWVVERKKFLIKLGWVIAFVTILLIIAYFLG